jgi:hypothetical protein
MADLILFWRSLKDHPGLFYGAIWSPMILLAVVGRKDFIGFSAISSAGWLGIGLVSALPWLPIIVTAWTGRQQYKDGDRG